MKLVVFASILASAIAFCPAPVANKAPISLNAFDFSRERGDFSNEVGAQMPLGFFGSSFAPDTKEEFDRIRYVELKHGRIAMLAVVGYLVTYAGVRFPGAENIPAGFAALDNIPGMVWAQMIATWAMMEAANQDQGTAPWSGVGTNGKPMGEFKGDFRNGALDFGWDKQSPEWKLKKRAVELNNGRAAQMGILGLMVHEKLGNIEAILPLGGPSHL